MADEPNAMPNENTDESEESVFSADAQNSGLGKYKTVARYITAALAIILTTYQVYTCIFGLLPPLRHRSIHVGLITTMIFLLIACNRKTRPLGVMISSLLGALSLLSFSYIAVNYAGLLMRVGNPRQLDVIVGAVLVILVLVAIKQKLGWALPVICAMFILYALFGTYLPAAIAHRGYSVKRIVSQLAMGTEGIFGMVAGTSATYIFLFCLFGTFLDVSGASHFFMQLAIALTGRLRGGSAKIACLASGLFGMISGSAAANVMTTGTFSIPLMKKSGYKPEFAGAVEAVSSTGGQFMPPIMGAAAFIIAETLGKAYVEIATAALVPAILYYLTVWFTIDLRARRDNIGGIDGYTEIPKARVLLLRQGYMLLPLILLILFLTVFRWSAIRAGLYASGTLIILSMFRKESRFTPRKILEVFEKTAYSVLDVGIVCGTAGIIIGSLSLTGLGIKFSSLLVAIAGGNQIVLLVLAAVAGLILGMGMTTSSVYIILSVLVCPALVDMGIVPLVAHLFVFYFGILSNITPPVATASFAAASLAKTDAFKLGFVAWKLGLAGYILPFMFVYGNELCLMGSPLGIVKAIMTASFGIYALCCALEGYYLVKLGVLQRLLMGAAALLLIDTGFVTDILGIGCALSVMLPKYLANRKLKTA